MITLSCDGTIPTMNSKELAFLLFSHPDRSNICFHKSRKSLHHNNQKNMLTSSTTTSTTKRVKRIRIVRSTSEKDEQTLSPPSNDTTTQTAFGLVPPPSFPTRPSIHGQLERSDEILCSKSVDENNCEVDHSDNISHGKVTVPSATPNPESKSHNNTNNATTSTVNSDSTSSPPLKLNQSSPRGTTNNNQMAPFQTSSQPHSPRSPTVSKARSPSVVVKKKVVVFRETSGVPMGNQNITTPPVIEPATKFSLLDAFGGDIDQEEDSDDDGSEPILVQHNITTDATDDHHNIIKGNPSKLFAYMDSNDNLSLEAELVANDTVKRPSFSVSDSVISSRSDLGDLGYSKLDNILFENNDNVKSYEDMFLETFKKNQFGNRLSNRISNRKSITIGKILTETSNYLTSTSNVQNIIDSEQAKIIKPQVITTKRTESKEKSTLYTTEYALLNCSNTNSENLYQLPQGMFTFHIATDCNNQETQLVIRFIPENQIDLIFHNKIFDIIDKNNLEESSNILYTQKEWSLKLYGELLDQSQCKNLARGVLRELISNAQEEVSNGFVFNSFEQLNVFIGKALQQEIQRRTISAQQDNYTQSEDRLRIYIGRSQTKHNTCGGNTLREMIDIIRNEPDYDFSKSNNGSGLSCTDTILFMHIQLESKLLGRIQFKLPLFPNSEKLDADEEKSRLTMEAQIHQLEDQLEEILYQKYQWEFLMHHTFKVFDSRMIDRERLYLSNQNRTVRNNGWGLSVVTLRCPITPPGGSLSSTLLLKTQSDVSSLKTNHILTLRLDSVGGSNPEMYVGITSAEYSATQMQNLLTNINSHTYALRENQFRYGNIVIKANLSTPRETMKPIDTAGFEWKEGDIIQLVLDYKRRRLAVFKNFTQLLLPNLGNEHLQPIDIEQNEWYFTVGLSQGQQVTIL